MLRRRQLVQGVEGVHQPGGQGGELGLLLGAGVRSDVGDCFGERVPQAFQALPLGLRGVLGR